MALHEMLASKREDIIVRWKAEVERTLAPAALPAFEIIDHIPDFLNEIIDSLRADAGLPPISGSPSKSATAAGHGAQRLRLGFSLDMVVREYTQLRNAIMVTIIESGEEVRLRDVQVIFDVTTSGVATAVSEYTLQRNAELQRQANEHFAFVAHELRNPLSSALMAFQLLQERGQLSTSERAVGALGRGLQRANELIEQTLSTARVASGVDVHREPTTLRSLFEDAELEASTQAEAKGVEIRATIANDRSMSLDKRLIGSALSNVVRNGVKYTPPGGVVELRGNVVNERMVIEVEDRCGGLKPGEVERAFAPFVRLDERQSGFGLGLAIAKQAIDAHGGSIRVQNVPGKCCIFVLEIPNLTEDVQNASTEHSPTT
jgi:signal transduction histidine kinase